MMDFDFKPKRSSSPNDVSEEDSVLCVRQLLSDTETKTRLSDNDKTANYDGYIELLVSDFIRGKITVQVKTYETRYAGARKFPVPTSLLGYAQSVPTEVVMLLVANPAENAVYWKHISREFIVANKSKIGQETITYHFTEDEILNRQNRNNVIEQWKGIYTRLAGSIADHRDKVQKVIESYANAFEHVDTHFFNLPNSHIERKELTEIDNWICKDVKEGDPQFNNVCIVTGNAGAGKSVVIKQLAHRLREKSTAVLAIKADMRNITSEKVMEEICEVIAHLSSDKTKRTVLLIDQIDALSQTLTNDRSQIRAYYGIINKFSSSLYHNLRIIVSCREFDLKYDPILNRLPQTEIIKIGKLQNEEVKNVLRQLLGEELVPSVQENTLELLQTPQYLDTYCRVYDNRLNFSSPLNLYEELWKVKILHPTNNGINPDALEATLSKIVRKIQKDQSLTVKWPATGNDTSHIDYLSTEGIVTRERAKLRFFHQSFSDYVFARKFISEETSIHQYLLDGSQGLFVRSSLKSSLEYLRDSNGECYGEQVSAILFDDRIRYHIKLLVLQHLASLTPTARDVQIILRLKEVEVELYRDFIKLNLDVAWFDGLVDEWKKELIQLKTIEEDQTIIRRLTCFTTERTGMVFAIIDEIENETIQAYMALDAWRFVTDHKHPLALKWYRKLDETMDDYDRFVFLEKALADNVPFVCEEVGRIFEKSIPRWSKEEKFSTDDRHLFREIIEPLVRKHPRDIYEYLKNTIVGIVNQTTMASVFDDYLVQDTAFTGYHSHDNHCRKLIKFLVQILKGELPKDAWFVKNEIRYFLSASSGTLYRIALEVMLESPMQFAHETFGLCKRHELIEYLLDNQREGYYFKELLKASYTHFTPEQKEQIRQNALNFISEREKIFFKGRRYAGHPILPSFGRRQRAFIYSLPNHALSQALQHKKDELDRRIPWEYTNKKESDGITAGHFCGGLVSDDIYERFSLKNWETSFLKLPNSQHRWEYHLSMDTHVKKFSECVQKEPVRFYPFVIEMFYDERMGNQFRMAGLRGLVEANYRIDNLYPLFLQLSKHRTDNELFEMAEIAELFIQFKSKYTPEISDYLLSIIRTEYTSVYNPDKENGAAENDRFSGLLTKGINTIQGRAIKAFIENAVFDSRRSYTYDTLIQLADILSIEHKLAVLYRMYHQEVYDEALFDKLLVAYLQHGVSEFLCALGNIIHAYLSCKPDLVTPYLRSVANLTRSQKTLGILSYLGAVYGVKFCEDMLESKLNDGNVEFVDGALKAAFTNFSHPSCNDLSLSVINKVADSSDKSIIKLFSYRFSKLDSKNFPAVKDAFYKCVSKTTKLKGAVDYLEKCCAEYPKECYDGLDMIIKNGSNTETGMEREEQIELLFAIYKYLKGSPDIQEKIMDTFDYVLKESVGGYGIHKILEGVTE